jgi:hypothetical protein
MLWLPLWITVLLLGVIGVVASANSLRFGGRVAREVRQSGRANLNPHASTESRSRSAPGPSAPLSGQGNRAARPGRADRPASPRGHISQDTRGPPGSRFEATSTSRRIPYVRFLVERLEIDAPAPF